jgi:hypothetical protein
MRIIIDVPDLGNPETTVMISVAVVLRLNKSKGMAASYQQ